MTRVWDNAGTTRVRPPSTEDVRRGIVDFVLWVLGAGRYRGR